MDTDGVT
jgi:hypothetical protein